MNKYGIVSANKLEELIKSVNQMIEKGYEPIGGILIQQYLTGMQYLQTIYMREPPITIEEIHKAFNITKELDTISPIVHPAIHITECNINQLPEEVNPHSESVILDVKKVDKRKKGK